jgi:transcriptional regulator with XRE-family HTH domain
MSTPREQLADLLKKSREDAGHGTQAAFAKRTHISRPVISRAENPDQPVPSPEVLEAYASETGASPGELEDLAKRANGGTPAWFMPYRQAESEATTLRLWGPVIVPGLLQTEPYAREVVAASVRSPARLDELVSARMERQTVLERVPLIAVISARALQIRIGTAAIMADQCGRLAELAEQPDTSIHVVTEENTGTWATLDIASNGGLATVCMSTGLQDVTSTDPETVDDAMRAFDRLLGLAISRDRSLDFMRNREAEWKEAA